MPKIINVIEGLENVMVLGFCDVMLWCKALTWIMCKINLIDASIHYCSFTTFVDMVVLVQGLGNNLFFICRFSRIRKVKKKSTNPQCNKINTIVLHYT
jgi:hypothetical protein